MSLTAVKLDRAFYLRPTLEVARDLIGKYLVSAIDGRILAARLVEVEAYIGENDPACHAAVGRTARNEIMYGQGGFSYIYFIYGMYHCLNVVTEKEGFPAAVLIRGAEPIDGVEVMTSRFAGGNSNRLTDGPGKLCKAFGLTRDHNGKDFLGSELYIEDRGYIPKKIDRSGRIGIKKAADKKWRFFESGSPYVSAGK
ncbi:MAG: 3-methyladenine DNA glycosylase [candidate division Zixibacteria bacterium HGW-Zixibacteria-1]|nr:MAG: 3-methyladenine DNA glycosylase [candidate division Zixibacteria bacterium HGW-Zixibacteria-1]